MTPKGRSHEPRATNRAREEVWPYSRPSSPSSPQPAVVPTRSAAVRYRVTSSRSRWAPRTSRSRRSSPRSTPRRWRPTASTSGRQFGIGSRETYIPAVKDHSIDLIPEYTGNLLQYFDQETKATDPDVGRAGALPRAARRSVDPDAVARQRPGHRRGHRRDRPEVEPQDHRRPRAALGRGEVRWAVGVPEPRRGAARPQGELRPRHRAGQLRRRSATAAVPRRCARWSTAP